MKKLKLNFQHLGNAEVLTRSQLKKIMGGNGGSGGDSPCASNNFICYTIGSVDYTCITQYDPNGDVKDCCCAHHSGDENCQG